MSEWLYDSVKLADQRDRLLEFVRWVAEWSPHTQAEAKAKWLLAEIEGEGDG